MIVFRIKGGEIGDIGLRVSHQPRFIKGEEVCVFLRKVDDNLTVYGGIWGKYHITPDQLVVLKEYFEEDGTKHPKTIPLADFKKRIRNHLDIKKK